MKEAPGAVDLANEYIIKLENKWLHDQTDHVDKMKSRAEKSNTTIAWNEFHSSETILFKELDRLQPVKNPKERNT